MTRQVVTYNEIEGLHRWPDAPAIVSYLRHEHRHVFVIRCWWTVSHNDREIEIITRANEVEEYLYQTGGRPVAFGALSCEAIAENLMKYFGDSLVKCEVLEDGFGGASLSR